MDNKSTLSLDQYTRSKSLMMKECYKEDYVKALLSGNGLFWDDFQHFMIGRTFRYDRRGTPVYWNVYVKTFLNWKVEQPNWKIDYSDCSTTLSNEKSSTQDSHPTLTYANPLFVGPSYYQTHLTLSEAQKPKSEERAGKIKFVNPIEEGTGDGEGIVRERRGDILLVDTGVDVIEVPVNLVYDGSIPSLPASDNPHPTHGQASWLHEKAGGIAGVAVSLVGFVLLVMALVSEQPSDIIAMMNIFGSISLLVGSIKLYWDAKYGKNIAQSLGIHLLISGMFVLVMTFAVRAW